MKLVLFMVLVSPAVFGVSLSDAFRAAQTKTEWLPIEAKRVDQADESVTQARADFMPTVSVSGGLSRQDTATGSALGDPNQRYLKGTLIQPIFRGETFGKLGGRKAELEKSRADRQAARLALWQRVIQVFFTTLQARRDLENLSDAQKLAGERLQELEKQTSVGRSRKADLLAARAQSAALTGQRESARATLARAEEEFRFATGLASESQLETSSAEIPPSKIPPVEEFLKSAGARPDLEAQRQTVAVEEEAVSAARAGHYPSLDLAANYYVERTGPFKGNDWDVGLTLTLPLFQGGAVQSKVRQAMARRGEKELNLGLSQRQIERDIRQLYAKLIVSFGELKAYEEASEQAELSYREQLKGARQALVSQIEVFQALQTVLENKRLRDRTRFDSQMSWAALNAAAGKVPLLEKGR